MPLDSVDITVVLNGHREGILIHRTLRSILRSVDFARARGISCEVVAVLDQSDPATEDCIARASSPVVRTVQVDYRDPALARNRGVAEAGGGYVAFVDGDDLISRNWLAEAYIFAQQGRYFGRRLALHPELNVFFGEESRILKHLDQESPDWSLDGFFVANYWTALAFARKEDLVAVPYRSSNPESGFGFEDWDWNCLSVDAGIVHKVIANTWHFIRVKAWGSRNQQAKTQSLLVRPSPIFERLGTEFGKPLVDLDTQSMEASAECSHEGVLDGILSSAELLAEWRDLALIEPGLFPTLEKLKRYRLWRSSPKGVGSIFGEIMSRWGPAPSHVILCDQFGAGDSGIAAQSYVQALSNAGAHVVVVAEKLGAVRQGYARKGSVRFLEFSNFGVDMPPFWSARLLGQALVQRPPQTIFLFESRLGYEAISSYGAAITEKSRIFASVAGLSVSSEGERTGVAVALFDRIAPHLSGLLSESHAVLDWFCDIFGFPRACCHRVRPELPPSTEFVAFRQRSFAGGPRVLWVGDDGQQSCPSMLIQIARQMPNCDFVVAFRKRPILPWSDALNAVLLAEPNIVCAPTSQPFDEAMAGASALLHTSLVDGLPGTIVDACIRGVPIVAPNLAAIRELVDEETGYPVEEFCRPDAYAACLCKLLGEPEQTRKRVEKAQRRLRKEYSWETFVDALQSIDGNRQTGTEPPRGAVA